MKKSAVNIFLYACEYTDVFSMMNVEKCMFWAHRKKVAVGEPEMRNKEEKENQKQ